MRMSLTLPYKEKAVCPVSLSFISAEGSYRGRRMWIQTPGLEWSSPPVPEGQQPGFRALAWPEICWRWHDLILSRLFNWQVSRRFTANPCPVIEILKAWISDCWEFKKSPYSYYLSFLSPFALRGKCLFQKWPVVSPSLPVRRKQEAAAAWVLTVEACCSCKICVYAGKFFSLNNTISVFWLFYMSK